MTVILLVVFDTLLDGDKAFVKVFAKWTKKAIG